MKFLRTTSRKSLTVLITSGNGKKKQIISGTMILMAEILQMRCIKACKYFIVYSDIGLYELVEDFSH